MQEWTADNLDVGLHRHDFYQMMFIIEGSIEGKIDFTHYKLEAGSASLIFPHQVHEFKTNTDLKVLVILFDDTILASDNLRNELKDYNADLQQRMNYVSFSAKQQEFDKVIQIWAELQELYNNVNTIKKLLIKLLVKVLILKILDISPERQAIAKEDENAQIYIAFRERIDNEIRTNRIVRNYASELGLSVKKLTDICRYYAGQTPLDIIHDKLNLELKKAFALGHYSFKEIANDFCFSSQAALNKYIVKHFNMTPMALKKRLRNYP